MDSELTRTIILVLQILLALVLIAVVLLQVRGQGGGLFGGGDGSYRTRRGIEKTMFNFTIVLVIAFVATSIASVKVF
ncbi:MAG: preprotein translocase subunit SecG [SAR202 cluster bacterium]|nr:preprotein translocase subunit SecG [SAR202 cluster bacterium]